MKVGSLFDGSGGFPLAGFLCGFEPVWAAEVEPYPIAVTKSRFPMMKHLGSVTDIKGGEVEPVDVICGGSPCQDLSVAGKRAGLKHEDNGDEETTRSGLFMEQKVYESHPMDSRIKELDGVSPTVSAKWHKGAADTPLVCEKTVAIEGNGGRPSHKGDGYAESDVMYTLNTIERHGVAYSDPTCVIYEEPIAIDRAYFNQGHNALYDPQLYDDGSNPTLVARGLNAVCVRYIVRRLTPTECARLQGFPDEWGHPDRKEEFTDDEYRFWLDVRNTHAAINGKAVKEYTKDQMLKWYNKLHTDSAEYKMWGNGIALPNALYVMQGIAEESRKEVKTWM